MVSGERATYRVDIIDPAFKLSAPSARIGTQNHPKHLLYLYHNIDKNEQILNKSQANSDQDWRNQ
jgi:hypothetical protein